MHELEPEYAATAAVLVKAAKHRYMQVPPPPTSFCSKKQKLVLFLRTKNQNQNNIKVTAPAQQLLAILIILATPCMSCKISAVTIGQRPSRYLATSILDLV
jgi:hypothetical protein